MSKRKTLSANHLKLAPIQPLTENQRKAFESHKHLLLFGVAGTGKTFISLYLAFKYLYENKIDYNKIVIVRSAVSTRDIGFLPGTEKEKCAVYEEPYRAICSELFSRGDAYQLLTLKGIVEFKPTSYIRGLTLNNTILVVDECQNMTLHELDSIITRVGEDCMVMFCGDFRQSDLKTNGLKDFINILTEMKQFDIIEYGVDDIVRSDFVKNYILAKLKLNL